MRKRLLLTLLAVADATLSMRQWWDFHQGIAQPPSSLFRRRRPKQISIPHSGAAASDDDDEVLPESDLTVPRNIHIVTTAALPWKTGTAINPLLRAGYLDRLGHNVTLVVPWLSETDQENLYGMVFDSMDEQAAHIRDWLSQSSELAQNNVRIRFYPARYHESLGSIFAMGDIIARLSDDTLDVCILEEPEHLNYYRAPGDSWKNRFQFVIGVIHTNYKHYATSHYSGLWTAPAISLLSSAMVRAYCDKVIKLSDTLQQFAEEKETTCNVHGVRSVFWKTNNTELSGIYFIGKLLWAKGFEKLLELQEYYKSITGSHFGIDVYGSGSDEDAIQRAFLKRRRPVRFPGRVDHAELNSTKILVNPSLSEVLCTTTAEALAMGKFVVIPVHPSNNFFLQFRNCLGYRNKLEFVANLRWAISHDPIPLSDEERRMFTWEAATERLIESAKTTRQQDFYRKMYGYDKLDTRIAKFHNEIGKGATGDFLRRLLGGGPVSDQVKFQRTNGTSQEDYHSWKESIMKALDLSAFSIQ